MPTLGELRYRLNKLAPGVDPDLLDQWILDRHQEILDALPWQRLDAEGSIQTVDEYNTGTAAVTHGSNAVTGTGTTWTSAMTGRRIRFNSEDEYYTFTRTGNTTGTLDRNYEGEDDTDATYRINYAICALSSAARIVTGVRSMSLPLDKLSRGELNAKDPGRAAYGAPEYYVPYFDDSSDPPVQQVELYPCPDTEQGLLYTYVKEVAPSPSSPGTSILAWMRPAALIAGVMADIMRSERKIREAGDYEVRFAQLVAEMASTEARRIGPTRLEMADIFVRHRHDRWNR